MFGRKLERITFTFAEKDKAYGIMHITVYPIVDEVSFLLYFALLYI